MIDLNKLIESEVLDSDCEKPFFMSNPEWFYHDEDDFKYKLTNKAPKKAIKSYNEYYMHHDSIDGAKNI